MNITFCIPNLVIGGVEMVLMRTLHELNKYDDINISVVLHAGITEPYFKTWFEQHPDIKLYVCYPWQNTIESFIKYTNFFPLKNIRKIIFSIYKKIKRHKLYLHPIFQNTDVFVDYKNFDFFKELRQVQKPKIVWCHGSVNFFEKANLIQRFKHYDKLVAITDSFVADFKQLYPEYADRVHRIYNPTDFDDIRKIAQNAKTESGKYFLVVARLDCDKDMDTVLDAFNQFWLAENKPDVRLIIVGDGCRGKELRQNAAKLQAGKNISFVGTVPQPFGYMRGALAHILSSKNEGFGMVLIESVAVGVLNISADCPNGPAEILMNGDAGLLFTPGAATELAKCMSDVWNNNIDIDKMKNCASNSLNRFSITTVIPQIKSFLSNELKRNDI